MYRQPAMDSSGNSGAWFAGMMAATIPIITGEHIMKGIPLGIGNKIQIMPEGRHGRAIAQLDRRLGQNHGAGA